MALLPHSPAFSPEEAPISPFTRLHSVPSNQSRDWTDNGCTLYTKANLTAQQLVIFNQRLENIVWKTESLQSFLAFVGYGRSSHTLLGALLDGRNADLRVGARASEPAATHVLVAAALLQGSA